MKIKKIDGVYNVSFRTAEGRTKTISTRCTNEEDARRVVKEAGIKDLEMAARAGRLSREAIGHITTGRKHTMAKAAEEFDKWMESVGSAPKTRHNNMTILRSWMQDTSTVNLPPSAIAEKHISKWINDPDSDATASTRVVKLSAFRTFFKFAAAKGWTFSDPSMLVRVDMSILSHAQKEKTIKQCFNRQEIQRLLADCEKEGDIFWEFAIRISDEVGLRLGDICQLEWECFTPDGLVVWTDKRDKRVCVPISQAIQKLSTEIPVRSARYLFPEERNIIKDVKKAARLSMQFKRKCERLGIKGKSFHSLRHTCITRWHKEGKSLESIGKDVGHSGTATTKGYIHT